MANTENAELPSAATVATGSKKWRSSVFIDTDAMDFADSIGQAAMCYAPENRHAFILKIKELLPLETRRSPTSGRRQKGPSK